MLGNVHCGFHAIRGVQGDDIHKADVVHSMGVGRGHIGSEIEVQGLRSVYAPKTCKYCDGTKDDTNYYIPIQTFSINCKSALLHTEYSINPIPAVPIC